MESLVGRPATGRVFETEVPIRFGDCAPGGRLRLDALARILQDAGNDDFADAGLDPASPWVARRSVVVAESGWPTLGDRVRASTWCGGLGSRWAERRSTLTTAAGTTATGTTAAGTTAAGTTAGGTTIEVATLWVHLDGGGRPARLPDWFLRTYGAAAGERMVSSRLHLRGPALDAAGGTWQVRASDLDVLGHVNNTVLWAPLEEELARRDASPRVVELEFLAPVLARDDVRLVADPPFGTTFGVWLTVGGETRVSAHVDGLPR